MIPQPRSRSSVPLLLAFAFLISYFLYSHSSQLEATITKHQQYHSTGQTPSPRVNTHQIRLSTDQKDWSKSCSSTPGISIYQPPLNGPQTSGFRIAMATMNTEETTYDHISLRNKFGYASKHNYGIKLDLTTPAGLVPLAVWHKLNMIEWLIRTNSYDWIWWLDYDTVITNTSITLESIITSSLSLSKTPSEVDLILTADCWPLNAGSMLIRSTPRLLPFLSKVWECGNTSSEPSEQDCILQVLKSSPSSNNAIWVPQTTMNSFPPEIPCLDKHKQVWEPGHFVAHFAGAWAHFSGKLKLDSYGVLMRKYGEWVDKTKLKNNEYQVLGSVSDSTESSVEVVKNPKYVDSDDEGKGAKKKKKEPVKKEGKSS